MRKEKISLTHTLTKTLADVVRCKTRRMSSYVHFHSHAHAKKDGGLCNKSGLNNKTIRLTSENLAKTSEKCTRMNVEKLVKRQIMKLEFSEVIEGDAMKVTKWPTKRKRNAGRKGARDGVTKDCSDMFQNDQVTYIYRYYITT